MTRPRDIPVVDLLVELPKPGADMGKAMASRLTKDAESSKYESHPAEYLFKDTGEVRREATTPAEVVALMDHYGIATAQIDVNPVRPRNRSSCSSSSLDASSGP